MKLFIQALTALSFVAGTSTAAFAADPTPQAPVPAPPSAQVQEDKTKLLEERKNVHEAKAKLIDSKISGNKDDIKKSRMDLRKARKARHEAKEKLVEDKK